MKRTTIFAAAATALLTIAATLCFTAGAAAQNDKKKAELERKVKELERQIKEGERAISNIKSDKSAAQERARRLTKQIAVRNDLLEANERQARLLQAEVNRTDSTLNDLASRLGERKRQYGEMVRESYRNYRNDNYLSYIFAADGFLEMARRIAVLREMAVSRGERIKEIEELNAQVEAERRELGVRQAALDSVKRKTAAEKANLQRDEQAARTAISKLSAREKEAMKKKAEQERQLSVSRDQLRKLTKGNTTGADFSERTQIKMPVEGGKRRKIVGTVWDIVAKRNARVNAIHKGKVVMVKHNADYNRYEVYIALGEDWTVSYSNLSEVTVKQGQTVERGQQVGVVGAWRSPYTGELEYTILLQVQSLSGKKFPAKNLIP